MHPDPGRDLLETRVAAMTPEDRVRIVMDLRARGFAMVWDQLDRAAPMGPVEQAMFLLERLYPTMPAVHREQLRAAFTRELAAGTWQGPVRPARYGPSDG